MLLARSVALTVGCVVLGVFFDAARPHGIGLVAAHEYEIFVPCPESTVEVESMAAHALSEEPDVTYVDARPVERFRRKRIKGAISFPYPVLDDPAPEAVEALRHRRGKIVTYGDGGRGDLGELLAQLLAEIGLHDISHLEGGLPAWSERDGEVEGEVPDEHPRGGVAASADGGEGGP